VLFGLYQLVTGLALYHTLWVDHAKVVFTSNSWSTTRLSVRFLAYSFLVAYRVFLQPLAQLTCYLVMLFSGSVVFSSHKGLDIGVLVQANSWVHILTFILLLVCFLETIVVSVWTIFFLNDYSILRALVWSTNDWQSLILEFLIKLYIPISFVYLARVRVRIKSVRTTATAWRIYWWR
jgi:hypothetical protein